jgi:uncharacterized protein YciW
MPRESDNERRQRQLAASREYAAQVANDPEMTRRIAEEHARIAANGFDERDIIPYEEMLRHLRGKPPKRPES